MLPTITGMCPLLYVRRDVPFYELEEVGGTTSSADVHVSWHAFQSTRTLSNWFLLGFVFFFFLP